MAGVRWYLLLAVACTFILALVLIGSFSSSSSTSHRGIDDAIEMAISNVSSSSSFSSSMSDNNNANSTRTELNSTARNSSSSTTTKAPVIVTSNRTLYRITVPVAWGFGTDSLPLDKRAAFVYDLALRNQDLSSGSAINEQKQRVLNSLRFSTIRAHQMSNCGQRLSDGFYWNYSSQQCVPIEGFRAPLKSFETGVDELSCSNKTARFGWMRVPFQRVRNVNDTLRWLEVRPVFFISGSKKNSTTTPVTRAQLAAEFGVSTVEQQEVERQYSRFIYYSGWLFRQFRKWTPRPVFLKFTTTTTATTTTTTTVAPTTTMSTKTLVTATGNATKQQPKQTQQRSAGKPPPPPPRLPGHFRCNVDDSLEKVMRIENVCISPLGGYLSGFGPEAGTRDRYHGGDDTLGAHNEKDYREYFKFVRPRLSVPRFFDQRPVVFMSAMYHSSHNMAHSHFKFWSLLGILRLQPFSAKRGRQKPSSDGPIDGAAETVWEQSVAEELERNKDKNNAGGENGTTAATRDPIDDAFLSSSAATGDLKPLIVFVLRADLKERKRARAYGFMYQMLDLPWAVALANPHDEPQIMEMMQRAGHAGIRKGFLADKLAEQQWSGTVERCEMQKQKKPKSSSTVFNSTTTTSTTAIATTTTTAVEPTSTTTAVNATSKGNGKPTPPPKPKGMAATTTAPEETISVRVCKNVTATIFNKDPSDRDEMCFQQAIAWQNCFHTDCTHLKGERSESYSFLNYRPINSHRRWMMARYEFLLSRCLPHSNSNQLFRVSTAAIASSSSSSFRRPLVFFSIRSASRSIWFSSLFMDYVRQELVDAGFVSDVVYRELWKGSRAEYLDELRSSDIFIGTHGGSFAAAMMLQPKPVVVELAASWSFCQPHQGPPGPFCWFDAQVDYKRGSHWVYEFDFGMFDGVLRVGSGAILDALKEASCRWYWVHYGVGVANASRNPSVWSSMIGQPPTFKGQVESRTTSELLQQEQNEQQPKSAERQQLEALVPPYCRDKSIVKFTDMRKLHVRMMSREKIEIDTREVVFLLRKFFGIYVNDASAGHLLRTLHSLGGKLGWRLESDAPDVFKVLLSYFIDARLTVHNRTERLLTDKTSPRRMSIRWPPHNFFEYPLERFACLRAASWANASFAGASSAAAVFRQGEDLARLDPDYATSSDDIGTDTVCLFVARIRDSPPPPGTPTLVAPAPTVATTAMPVATSGSSTPSSSSGGGDPAAGTSPKQQQQQRRGGGGSRRGPKRVGVPVGGAHPNGGKAVSKSQGLRTFVVVMLSAVCVGLLVALVMVRVMGDDDHIALELAAQETTVARRAAAKRSEDAWAKLLVAQEQERGKQQQQQLKSRSRPQV